MDKFIIECRYEANTSNGKTFTKWFIMNSKPMSEDECKVIINKYVDDFGVIDKKTKLKHEYRLKKYDEYLNERDNIKKEIEELSKKQEEYYKSDKYKELQRKKRKSAKELKERQKKYIIEHQII